jgi:Ca-activated chloride channel homolog
VALVVVVAGAWVGLRQLTEPACSGQVRVTVAAAAEIAPAVQAAAAQWSGGGAEVDNVCVAVDVTAAEPADVAAAVAGRHGVNLNGVGQASGTTPVPDVWIPDSGIWLLRLTTAASGFTPTSVTSIARSPVVLAVPEPIAAQAFQWPTAQLTWGALITRLRTGTGLSTGIVEPTRDAAGLAGLLALGQAAGAAGADSPGATTGALRALAQGRSALRQELLAKFPRSTDPAAVARALTAAPLSEQSVIAYNAAKPPIQLAALYVEPAPMSLDYPLAIMPGIDPAKARAAEGLQAALGSSSFRDRLATQGLRGPDGVGGSGFASPAGAPTPAGTPSATSAPGAGGGGAEVAAVERTLSAWTAITLPARMLAVIDVSGSMLEEVPTARNATRAQVTAEAAKRGLALFDDTWAVGLWAFSTELEGARDWRELAPIGPLSSNRSALAAGLNQLQPKRNGDTGLYDSLLAAYKTVQKGWDPGRVNSVVMLTDGENDDDNGISLAQLLAELKRIKDTKRPIQVVMIGIGPSVGPQALQQITKVTGGGVFTTDDPAKIGEIFLKAVALRTQTAQPQ